MTKKLYIKTYGCQMNAYDTVRMADALAPHGYAMTSSPQGADLVILNTCHIREKAEEKVYSDLGRIRAEKQKRAKDGDRMLIAVGGCVGQAAGEEIFRRAPYVDIVLGPQSYHKLPEMVTSALSRSRVIDLEFPADPKFDLLPEERSVEGASAFLSVQEGCDKFCTFCVVPYTRGPEYSRGVEPILLEARQLAEKGVLELTLLGQNVNAYHGVDAKGSVTGLAALIERLATISGIRRIRYTTSHPRDMDDALIAAHRDVPQLMPYLHLPVQSGSDAVLKRMNRKHTAAFYLEIIEKLRAARPDMAFSSDFIVGFPGESDDDFEATLRLIETVNYAQAYSFKYSARPGTPAAEQDAQVPEPVKESRLAALQALLNRQQERFNTASVGQVQEVLLERMGKHAGQWIGKNPYMQSVHVMEADAWAGKLVSVKQTEAFANSLAGNVIHLAEGHAA